MAVKVLAVSKNHSALKFLQNKLDGEISITDYCVLAVANDMYCFVNPDIMLIEIKWSHVYIAEVYQEIRNLFEIKPDANVVAMTTVYNGEIEKEVRALGVRGYVFLECSFMNDRDIVQHFSHSILEASKGNDFFVA